MMGSNITSAGSPATLFVRYLVVGLTLLFALIFLGKPFFLKSTYVYHLIGSGIFLVNLFTVVGFTHAVLKSPLFLADQDAPDLAYYLGFSLTVGALAATFISDVALVSDDSGSRTRLVTGALSQFGAGLLATLIGLCAKIILSSKQQKDQIGPEEFYRRVRNELSDLSNSVRFVNSEMSEAINQASKSIREAGQTAQASMLHLSTSLKDSADFIAMNLHPDRVSKPIIKFIEELDRIKAPSESVRFSLESLEKSAKTLNGSLDAMNLKTHIVVDTAVNFGDVLTKIIPASVQLTEVMSRLVNVISEHAKAEGTVAAALDKSAQQVGILNQAMDGLTNKFSDLGTSVNESKVPFLEAMTDATVHLGSLKSELDKVSGGLSAVNNAAAPLESSVTQLSTAVSAHVQAEQSITAVLGQVIALVTSLATDIKFLSQSIGVIRDSVVPLGAPLSGALSQASQRLVELVEEVSRATPSIARLTAATSPLSVSLASINAPLEQTRDSLGQLQQALVATIEQTRVLQDVVTRLQRDIPVAARDPSK